MEKRRRCEKSSGRASQRTGRGPRWSVREINQPLLSDITVGAAVVLLDVRAVRAARALDVEAHGSGGAGRLHGANLIPAEAPRVELPELVRRVLAQPLQDVRLLQRGLVVDVHALAAVDVDDLILVGTHLVEVPLLVGTIGGRPRLDVGGVDLAGTGDLDEGVRHLV